MQRLFNVGLLLSFLICYLEWGGGNSGFLFQFEYQIFFRNNSRDFIHPLIIIPFLGQIFLLVGIFWSSQNRRLTLIGMILLSVLVFVILLVGILSLNSKIILSTLPFFLISFLFIRWMRSHRDHAKKLRE